MNIVEKKTSTKSDIMRPVFVFVCLCVAVHLSLVWLAIADSVLDFILDFRNYWYHEAVN
jgi:hypothetical protein